MESIHIPIEIVCQIVSINKHTRLICRYANNIFSRMNFTVRNPESYNWLDEYRCTLWIDMRFYNYICDYTTHSTNSKMDTISIIPNLRGLNVRFAHINNINFIDKFPNLTKLDAEYVMLLQDISPISILSNLEILHLRSVPMRDIYPLSSLLKLRLLDIAFCDKISSFEPLRNLTNLHTLDISNTNISDVTILTLMTNLQYLNIINTYISNCKPLAYMPKLKELRLSAWCHNLILHNCNGKNSIYDYLVNKQIDKN